MYLTFTEAMRYSDFYDRLEYLKQSGVVGEETFGFDRYLNQMFYKSTDWRNCRKRIIFRDKGNDLSHEDFPIIHHIYIHHLNPITKDDIFERNPKLFDPENLICCSFHTHQAITYGLKIDSISTTRKPNDTLLW